ncbi:MAG: EamA family transporter, partial [Promethearchaeota archaeon]
MEDNYNKTHIFPSNNNKAKNLASNKNIGIFLSFISLILLGILPIISNSRPLALDALNFAFYLSFWELICSLPLFIFELSKQEKGIFQKTLNPKIRKKTFIIMGFTGLIFSISTFFYVLSFETAGTISAAIAIQTYPLFSISMEFIIFNKKKQIVELFFTLIIIIGIYYLGTQGTWLIIGFSPWFALALIVPFLWSIAHV